MLDLETMGTSSNSLILSIGAVEFDKDFGIVSKFYEVIDIQSSLDKGFEISGDTLNWWLKRSIEAKTTLFTKQIPIIDALRKFKEWLGTKDNLQIWGNGADFDNVILQNAYKRFKADAPWKYYENRCFRTMQCSFPSLEGFKREGAHHNAVDDAEHQAKYLVALVEKYKLMGVL